MLLIVVHLPSWDTLQATASQAQPSSPVQFDNVTQAAGIHFVHFKGTNGTSTILEETGPGVCVADYDGDGWMDIYFVNGRDLYSRGISAHNALYRNNGDGTFTNVSKAAKMYQPNGLNLAVGAADYDEDGRPDLFVANDGSDAFLYHDDHDGTFTNVGMETGVALSQDGGAMAAMCISLADYDNDGHLDLYISDFQDSPDHIWRNDGKGFFDEVGDALGIAEPTRHVLSFDGGFFDYDNDGWLDLFIANGHVYPEVEIVSPEVKYKQFNMLFRNDGKGKFLEVSKVSGNGFAIPYAGRGVAFADFDNDGKIDLVVGNNNDPPLLLHNRGGTGNHFLNFKLVGTKSNREATGARIRMRAGVISQIREVMAGGSYLSHSDLRAHFGLGQSSRAESVEVWWPSGLRQTFPEVAGDRFYVIEEGKDQLTPQKSIPPR